MADHQEMIHAAAPAMYGGGGAVSSATTAQGSHGGGDWWSAVVASSSCSAAPEMPGFGAGWSAAVAATHADVVVDGGGNTSRSAGNAAASSESPGSNSLATGSSITFQEPVGGVADPAAIAVPQTVAAPAGGWNQQPFLDGTGFHGYMSSRSDHAHAHHHVNTPSLMSHSSSNNSMLLQDHHHDQNYQFLSNLGFELLSSPTSPYGGGGGGFRSSLLRSLTEPAAAAAKPSSSPGFQQYHQQPPPATAARETLQFTNSTAPLWNPSTGFAVAADGPASLGAAGPPPPAQPTPASLAAKSALEGVGDSSSIITKKAKGDATPLKKSRTGTQSPLPPTFKVRKEKLGDRITALQQLVSPFGKTDTASVLHETIEYIKFLHDQVGALSAPYLKNRQQVPHLKSSGDNSKHDGGEATAASKRDLTGRGLCLVPISSTFAVASETPVDFWTPFGAGFR